MPEKSFKFEYETEEQLRSLLEMISKNSVSLTVFMNAVVPEEFHKLRQMLHPTLARTRFEKDEDERYATFLESMQRLVELAHKEKVMPFTDFVSRIGSKPEVVYGNHYWPTTPEIDTLFDKLQKPNYIAEGWRYYFIGVENARDAATIKSVKELALGLQKDKYQITQIYAGLNPKNRGEYYDYTEYDVELHASHGNVTITFKKQDKIEELTDKLTFNLEHEGIKPIQIENLHYFLAKFLRLKPVSD